MPKYFPAARARGAEIIGRGRVLKVLLASMGLAIIAGIGLAIWVTWFMK